MRIALGVEYDGRNYYGWQKQADLSTIQGSLELALSKVADQPIEVFCAGRTDAGVHAFGQVVHFDTTATRIPRAWIMGTQSYLPADISVHWAQVMDENFHARFSALSRQYQYIIFNAPSRPAILTSKVSWFYEPLDIDQMQISANYLLGEHDFTSFRAAECASKTAMRHVHHIHITRHHHFVIVDIKANAFLHHMVRNIVGVLKKVGSGKADPIWAKAVLEAKDRTCAAATAAPDGLYLARVEYPSHYPIFDKETPLFPGIMGK